MSYIKNIIISSEYRKLYTFLLLFIITHIPVILNNDGNINAYMLFTQALLDKKLYLSMVDGYHFLDLIHYNDKVYLPYPPFPAIFLLIPAILVGINKVNPVFICVLLTILNFFSMKKILDSLAVSKKLTLWILLAFFFGTGYWYVLITSHHVYGFAHISCVTMLLLAIREAFGKRRGWIIGFCLGAAFLSRQMSVFTGLFLLYFLVDHEIQKNKINYTNILLFAGSALLFLGIYFWYNYERFGNILQTGYEYIAYIGPMKARVESYGVFNIQYLPFNFYTMFIKGHNIVFEGSTLMNIKSIDLFGTSIITASPYLVFVYKCKWRKDYIYTIGAAISIILVGLLLYHNNGYHQVNTNRFALDFMPLLFLLFAKSLVNIPTWLIKGSIAYAVGLNVLSFAIHAVYQ